MTKYLFINYMSCSIILLCGIAVMWCGGRVVMVIEGVRAGNLRGLLFGDDALICEYNGKIKGMEHVYVCIIIKIYK